MKNVIEAGDIKMYIVFNNDILGVLELFDNEEDAKFYAETTSSNYKKIIPRNLEKERKLEQQRSCSHSSMSGNGEYLKCNNCGYIKITQYYY